MADFEEIEVDGHTYQLGKMNAMEQLYVALKLARVYAALGKGQMSARQMLMDRGVMPPNRQITDGGVNQADDPPTTGFAAGSEGGDGEGKSTPEQEMVGQEANLQMFLPVAEELSKLEQPQIDFIIKTCLGKVRRRTPAGWQPVMAGGRFQFEADMNYMVLLRIVYAMVDSQLGGF